MTKTRNKRIWLLPALALAVIAGLTAWLWWESAPKAPPQIITLPSGEQFRFAGATYGTRNVPPSFLAHVVSWLPAPLAKIAKRYVGKRISQANEGGKYEIPQLFVWFQRLGTNKPSAGPGIGTAMLSDDTGVQAGIAIDYPVFDNSVVWSVMSFPVFPRRSRALQLTLYQLRLVMPPVSVGTVTVPNPLYRHFEQWKPEPVPAVKQAGDLQVRLAGFATGIRFSALSSPSNMSDSGWLDYRTANKGQSALTGFDYALLAPPGAGDSWVLRAAELSDATGNVLGDGGLQGSVLVLGPTPPTPAVRESMLHGTLWPDEAAWRLKLVLKRASGFAPGELVTFTNVPVPAMGTTNQMFLSQTVGGIQVVLTEFVRQPNLGASGGVTEWLSRIKVELPAKPAGVAVDFLETPQGVHPSGLPGSGPDSTYVFYLDSIPANVQTMYFTFAVQKTRSVEFLVAPPKPK